MPPIYFLINQPAPNKKKQYFWDSPLVAAKNLAKGHLIGDV
jgi:hypothetical protein